MRHLFPIIYTLIISIFISGCNSSGSSNRVTITEPEQDSNCPTNQSLGCDSICAEIPLQNDACGVCGGDGSSCEGVWNVYYNVSVPMGGFQFDIENAISITHATGGAAEAAGFMISSGTTTVIGFSLSGEPIPAGIGIFVGLYLNGESDSTCITNLIVSDTEAEPLDAIISNCNTITYSE